MSQGLTNDTRNGSSRVLPIGSAALLVAGLAQAAEPFAPQPAPLGTMPGERVAHIYYNVATGERVATLLGDGVSPRGTDSPEVWIADNTLLCAAFGQTEPIAGVMDSPFSYSYTGPQMYLDWGDIPSDTVVDCVGVTWSSQVRDADLNGDGVGDGVEGFGATWAWYDGENGFDSAATRKEILSITLRDLPGQVEPPSGPDAFATYEATIDLAPGAGPSLAFEIGDTDSVNGAGTPFFNPGGALDLDFDGLADFGYSLQYTQPGTVDFDGDGAVDGDRADRGLTGWTLVAGNGGLSPDGNTYLPETEVPGALGIEDAFDVLAFAYDSENVGTFFYSGFGCDLDGNGVFEPGDNSNPYAQFYMKLYGGVCGTCEPLCPADIFPAGDPDGVLNFFDISAYIDLFVDEDPRANIVASDIADFTIDFFDLSAYLALFNTGCP